MQTESSETTGNNEQVGTDREQWPAVDRAYDFVIPSYQLLASRFEAADTRLTAMLTLTSTLTLAVPIFAKSLQPDISFASPFFASGMAIFLIGSIIGIFGRVMGSLTLPDPMVIYETGLQDSEWEFKKDQIYFAGENFNANLQAVRKKGNVSIFMTVTLLLEIVAFVTWIIG
jgi:hypothetical protein